MEPKNESLYDVICVPPTASLEEIKEACLRLGEKHRPDKNGGLEAHLKFVNIERAYETLTDPKLRAAYDDSLSKIEAKMQGIEDLNHSHETSSGLSPQNTFSQKLKEIFDGKRYPHARKIVIGIVILAMFYSVASRPPLPSTAGTSRELRLERLKAETKIRLLDAVRSEFKDPQSAQFEDVQLYVGNVVIDGVPHALQFSVCGRVNAKNAYGAYVGFQPFFVVGNVQGDPSKGLQIWTDIPKYFSGRSWDLFLKNQANFCRDTTEQAGASNPVKQPEIMQGTIR